MYFNLDKIQGFPQDKLKLKVVLIEKVRWSSHTGKAKMRLRTGRDRELGMKQTKDVTIYYEGFKLSITI